MPNRPRLSNPILLASLVVLILAARWIWVAGLGDYGWSYEVAARILRGGLFFRDFLLLLGPLSHYTLAGLMALFGEHLFVSHLNLWTWYALSVGAGLLVVRELGAPRPGQAVGVSLAAVIACPVFAWGHPLNYQAPFLAGIGIFCALRAGRSRPHLWAAAAGVAVALCIHTKQNVGLALAVATLLALPWPTLASYGASLAAVFLTIFSYFAARAGALEVWRQLFVDAAAAKGGVLITALRALPRLIFDPGLPARRCWELAATAAVYILLLPTLFSMTRRFAAPAPAGPGEASDTRALARAILAGLVLSVAFSLVEFNAPVAPVFYAWPVFLELSYIFFALLGGMYLLRVREPRWSPAVLLTLAVTVSQAASNLNFQYSAPLAVPLLCALWFRAHPPANRELRTANRLAGAAVAAVYLIGTTAVGPASFYGLCAYQPTHPLPDQSPFRGLRAPEPYARAVREAWQELRPIVDGRRTLWLIPGGGPFSAYGARPVFNAPYYMPDSFPVRRDRDLLDTWQRDPPEVVVLSDHFNASPVLTADSIKTLLLSRYEQVWHGTENRHWSAWRRKPPYGGL